MALPIKALGERATLVEAGPVFGAELQTEQVDHTQQRRSAGDEKENGHAPIVGLSASLFYT